LGTVLDTTIFIQVERASHHMGVERAVAAVGERLQQRLGTSEEVGIAAITASELLHGVHRATSEHRPRREAFVEGVLTVYPTLPFHLLTARAHATIWAELVKAGTDIGAHDRLVAATAIAAGWRVATANVRDFVRVPGLTVVRVRLTG
jgi:tRNA(fMet)-specific endonuclease VapC